jgi:hypothetical protein
MTKNRYNVFLQSPCGYACGDYDTSAFGPEVDVVLRGSSCSAQDFDVSSYECSELMRLARCREQQGDSKAAMPKREPVAP